MHFINILSCDTIALKVSQTTPWNCVVRGQCRGSWLAGLVYPDWYHISDIKYPKLPTAIFRPQCVWFKMFNRNFHTFWTCIWVQIVELGMFCETFSFTTFATFTTFTLSFTLSRHAEQLLFSCLCSKVTLTLTLFHFHYFHNFHPLSTCWTTFVSMSRLKSRCL